MLALESIPRDALLLARDGAGHFAMSGSPAVTERNEVVGILVEGVRGTEGQQLYLETLTGVPFPYPQNIR